MVQNWFSELSRFILFALVFVLLLVVYGFVLQQFGIIPIGGKRLLHLFFYYSFNGGIFLDFQIVIMERRNIF